MKPKNYISKEQYFEVLEKINSIYQSRKPNEILRTIIEFTNGQNQQTSYKLESITDNETKVLIDCTFDSNYDFVKKFLNPAIQNYASNFMYASSQILKPEYFNVNIRSYISNALDGSSLTIKDANLDYLLEVDSYMAALKQILQESEGEYQGLNNNLSI